MTPYTGIFCSTDSGAGWTDVSTGLTYQQINALAATSTDLFAGTFGDGVWRRPLSEITSVQHLNGMPSPFALAQNYPNPFNPSTMITFDLPSKAYVSIRVFDALGREAAVVLSEELRRGTYTRQWNAAGLASGVYFYRLQAGSFAETRKLIVLK